MQTTGHAYIYGCEMNDFAKMYSLANGFCSCRAAQGRPSKRESRPNECEEKMLKRVKPYATLWHANCMKRFMKNEHWEVAAGVTCIKLSLGMYALVDTCDLPLLQGKHWRARRPSHSKRAVFYGCSERKHDGKRGLYHMHREIMRPPEGHEVDHADGNGLNNSSIFGKKNISIVTHGENMQNLHRTTTSRYSGVCYCKLTGKWRAEFRSESEKHWLGRFDTELGAKLALDSERKRSNR
jgi:hypothetical protein